MCIANGILVQKFRSFTITARRFSFSLLISFFVVKNLNAEILPRWFAQSEGFLTKRESTISNLTELYSAICFVSRDTFYQKKMVGKKFF